jgi:hypothetical protein
VAKLTLSQVRQALILELGGAASYFQGSTELEDDDAAAAQKTTEKLNALIKSGLAILGAIKPLRSTVNINLIAGKKRYDLPSHVTQVITHDWGKQHLKTFKPWQPQYPKFIPCARFDETETGPKLVLTPAPTMNLINQLTSFMGVSVTGLWRIEDDVIQSNVSDKFLPQVLMACQVAAMKHILVSRAGDPLKQQAAKNMNPAAVQDSLMGMLREWATA